MTGKKQPFLSPDPENVKKCCFPDFFFNNKVLQNVSHDISIDAKFDADFKNI